MNCVVGFLVDKKSLLDPALDAAGRTDASKSLFAVDDLDALPVLDVPYAVVNGRNLVAQGSLRRRNVRNLEYAVTVTATGEPHGSCQYQHRSEAE